MGLEPSLLGQRIEDPVVLDFGEPRESAPGNWLGSILHVDRFGNLVTNFEAQRFRNLPGGRFEILAGAASVTSWRRSYSEGLPGEVFLIAGSAGYVEICANRDHAAKRLGIQAGAQVRLLISD